MRFPTVSVEQAFQLAETFRNSGQVAVAESYYRNIVASVPTCFPAWSNLGSILLEKGALREGGECLRTASSLAPDNALIHMNLATIAQWQGSYREGWEHYEWRLHTAEFVDVARFTAPRWDGRSLSGKTLLVHAEQGLGDTIHFFRYLPLLEKSSQARIAFVCDRSLVRLCARTLPNGVEIFASDAGLPAYDAYLPLLSSPLVLEQFEPVSMTEPYLCAADGPSGTLPESTRDHLRVGVVWAGSAKHRRDGERSLDPSLLAPLLHLEDVRFFSFQIGQAPPNGMTELTSGVVDFADTADRMAQMDLIMTVDTAAAHLAGALGRPVWTLLPFVPDWRWGLQGETTPWYPTMRLFRQRTAGDWGEVIERVRAELQAWAAGGIGVRRHLPTGGI